MPRAARLAAVSPTLGLGFADALDFPKLRDIGRTLHCELGQFAIVEDQIRRQALMFGLAATPQTELVVDFLSRPVKLRAPILACGLRRRTRSAAVVRKFSVAQDQQERRRLFVNKKMFRNVDHVLAQLEIGQLAFIEKSRGRVQTQGENLELHCASRAFGLRALLRSLAGRGLRARPANDLRKRIYDNKFTSKGQVSTT